MTLTVAMDLEESCSIFDINTTELKKSAKNLGEDML
jgi:hypothetical protein